MNLNPGYRLEAYVMRANTAARLVGLKPKPCEKCGMVHPLEIIHYPASEQLKEWVFAKHGREVRWSDVIADLPSRQKADMVNYIRARGLSV